MALDGRTDAELSRYGSGDAASGVFAMTALPDDGQSDDDEDDDDDFFEDGIFSRLAVEFGKCPDDPALSELYAKLTSKADRCRVLRASIEDLRARLLEEARSCEYARRDEAERQRESDGMMDLIKKKEEDAIRMENAMPILEERAKELEREIDETKRFVALGPGWTREQQRRRCELSDAIDRGRSEATEKNVCLADLRYRLGSMEKEVEASIKRRDQSIESLERVTVEISEEQEKEQAVLLQYREAERSKGVLAETLRVAEIDLADTRTELVNETRAANDIEREIMDLSEARESCSRESEALRENEDRIIKELKMITSENGEIEAGNATKRKQLDEIFKEVQRLENDRAKSSRVRELINTKTAGADKERGVIQKELDSLAVSASTLESTLIPSARKEIEVIKREIKRQEQRFGLVNRNIGLSKKGSARVLTVIEANENTLLSQHTELIVMKKAVAELQKEEKALVLEEKRDEETLKRIYEVLQKKHQSQKSQEETNRSLELTVTKAEKITEQKRNECENAREEHIVESKCLICLKGKLSAAKMELLSFMAQIKSIKDDISRAEDRVFKEHVNHHNVDLERQLIETDIAAFRDKISRLNQTRNSNGCAIVQLGHEIDDVDQHREVIRRNYRNLMQKKDIASALLVATEVEHRKIAIAIESTTVEICGTMNRFHQLEEALESTKATTKKLLDEKRIAQALIESQGKQNEILAGLENDLEKQQFKNTALAVEIGRPMNLHRWRFLQDKAPQQFSMLERIHNLQRHAIDVSQRIVNQTCNLERSQFQISKLSKTVSCHQSVDDMRSLLSSLKSEFTALNAETKALEKQLQERIDQAADLNLGIVSLEKKSMDLKTNYIVSVISGR